MPSKVVDRAREIAFPKDGLRGVPVSRRMLLILAVLALVVGVLAPAGALGADRSADLTASPDGLELLSSATRQKADITGGDLVPVVIVLEEYPVASYEGGIVGLPATSPKATGKPINARAMIR